jgi:L-fuculose-phosphate aldolase
MIAVGRDLADAMRVAIEVESLCEQYWRALQIGSPHILSADEMAQVIEKFKTYGPKAQGK